jgi:hypothetical protein
MKIGDLIKYRHPVNPEEDDIGVVIEIKGTKVTLLWSKYENVSEATIKAIKDLPEYFELVDGE